MQRNTKMLVIFVIFAAFAASIFAAPTKLEVKEKEITYVFYSRQYLDGIFVTSKDVGDVVHIRKVFNPNDPTIVLVHGWKDGFGADSNTYIRKAILSELDANIIKVDWSIPAGKLYIIAKNAVPAVGKFAGKFIHTLTEEFDYSLKNVTVVGFSLGAHVAGNIGKQLGSGKLSLIIGLDPASPLVSAKDTKYRLCTDDAEYVQVIHCDAGGAGMKTPIGHSDFFPNNGKNQPGCSETGCSHGRSWEYYAESITNNKFVSQQCASYSDYENKKCNGDYSLMGGFKVNRAARGVYYLDTNSKSPFGRG